MPKDVLYKAKEPDSPGHTPVYAEPVDGDEYELDKRLDLANHSPDGFSWGYGGSGPAQLALAILADYYDDETALEQYQAFKSAVVAKYDDSAPFYVNAGEIERAIESE